MLICFLKAEQVSPKKKNLLKILNKLHWDQMLDSLPVDCVRFNLGPQHPEPWIVALPMNGLIIFDLPVRRPDKHIDWSCSFLGHKLLFYLHEMHSFPKLKYFLSDVVMFCIILIHFVSKFSVGSDLISCDVPCDHAAIPHRPCKKDCP